MVSFFTIQTPTRKNLLLYKAGYLLYLAVHFCTVLVFLRIVSGKNIVILLSLVNTVVVVLACMTNLKLEVTF